VQEEYVTGRGLALHFRLTSLTSQEQGTRARTDASGSAREPPGIPSLPTEAPTAEVTPVQDEEVDEGLESHYRVGHPLDLVIEAHGPEGMIGRKRMYEAGG